MLSELSLLQAENPAHEPLSNLAKSFFSLLVEIQLCLKLVLPVADFYVLYQAVLLKSA